MSKEAHARLGTAAVLKPGQNYLAMAQVNNLHAGEMALPLRKWRACAFLNGWKVFRSHSGIQTQPCLQFHFVI